MTVKSVSVKLAGVFLGLVVTMSASANLIVNGGFEDNNVSAGNWDSFSASSVNGWEGSNLEIWDHYGGVIAPEGQQHAELNAHPYTGNVFSIFQNFSTVIGQAYDVSFFYGARASNSEAFSFSVGTLNTLLTNHVVGQWTQYTNSFIANATSTTIRFTSIGADTVGNFLDGVSVVTKANVPEPGPMALIALGLVGLGLIRRRSRG